MFKKIFGSPINNLFDQATDHYQNLRYYEVGSSQYVDTIIEIIRLCQMAIQSNKNDGDAHVLLANAYFLASLSCTWRKGSPFFLAKAAAVIQATRSGNMYIKNNDISDKVYIGIVDKLSEKMPDWFKGFESLPKDMNLLQKEYYDSAISPLSLDEVNIMLTSE